MDEVRVFTFAAGTFATNYLLLNVPEKLAQFTQVLASAISSTGATLNAMVTGNGPAGAGVQVWFQYGLTTNYDRVTITNTIAASPAQPIATALTGLQASAVYHYRVVANNGTGVSSSDDMTFFTQVLAPTVTVRPVSSFPATNATLNALVNPNEAATTVYFLWGRTAGHGQTNVVNLDAGYTAVPVADTLSNLLTGTQYHYEIVASNALGITLSGDQVFTTGSAAPTVGTLAASGITATTATLNGVVNPNSLATAAYFSYGLSTNFTSPAIPNPGFEADTYTGYPGYANGNGGGITGWTISFPNREGVNSATLAPFADNGAIPEGHNVAFIQSLLVLSGLVPTLGTTLTDLAPGQAYQVTFRANSRAASAPPNSTWSLNGGAWVAFTAWPPVGGTNAYYTNSSTFLATGTTATLQLRNQLFLQDSAVLVDDFRIAQVGGGVTGPIALTATNVAMPVVATITGLRPGTTCYYRLNGTNGWGSAQGETFSFTTPTAAPAVVTAAASAISAKSATLTGTVNPNGEVTTAYFQYGVTTNYGTFSTTNNLTADYEPLAVASLISNLIPATTYHYQLVGSNGTGATPGADLTFTTLAEPKPTDILFNGVFALSGGTLQLSFTNVSGLNFTILGTTNLAVPVGDWTVRGAAVELPSGSGNYQFVDPQATTNATQFYRVRSP